MGTTNPQVKLPSWQWHIAVTGTYGLYSYGVGAPKRANTEFLTAYHNGAGGAFLATDKTGTGTYRNLNLQAGGSTRLFIQASDGNLGIASTSPAGILDIGNNTSGIILRAANWIVVIINCHWSRS